MIEARQFLEAGQQLQGHKCPAMPLGLRAGAAAMNALAVARAKDKELFAELELGDDHCAHCFADGGQMITGCTFGKGNIRKASYGKFGLTLAGRRTPHYQENRVRGIPAARVPDEAVDPVIERYLRIDGERMGCIPCLAAERRSARNERAREVTLPCWFREARLGRAGGQAIEPGRLRLPTVLPESVVTEPVQPKSRSAPASSSCRHDGHLWPSCCGPMLVAGRGDLPSWQARGAGAL